MPTPLLRPPFNWWTPDPLSQAKPSNPSVTTRRTHFLHPGYSPPSNILFSLPALDHGGIHYGVALTACIIVSGNRPGNLSTSPHSRGSDSSLLRFDDVLMKSEYYFHPESGEVLSDVPYPICPDFRSWLFPHRQLPKGWAELSMPVPSTNIVPTAYSHDYCCRITACSDGVRDSHIVPYDELEWFSLNSMSIYNTNQRLPLSELVSDTRNTFPLRADLLSAFNEGKFVFVPKENKPTIHILTQTQELTPLYHNRPLHPFISPGGPPCEFLYARFAYSIFPLLAGFFGGGVRRVCTATKGKGREGLGGLVWEIEWIDWGDILRWRAGSGVGGGMAGVAVGEIVRHEEHEEHEEFDEEYEEGPEEDVRTRAEGNFVVR